MRHHGGRRLSSLRTARRIEMPRIWLLMSLDLLVKVFTYR